MRALASNSHIKGTLSFAPSLPGAPATRVDEVKETDSLLSAILPSLQAAVWKAWTGSLELASLDLGRGGAQAPFLDRSFQRAGLRWLDHVCPLDLNHVEAFFLSEEPFVARRFVDYRLILRQGELLWVRHWLLGRDIHPNGRTLLSGLILAIPEQKRLEWECLRVSERERNRIGHELHDDLCQVLAGLSYMMQVLGGKLAKTAPNLRQEFDELNRDLTGAMERTRSMAHGLFPASLTYTTMRHALGEFARQIKTRFGVTVELEFRGRLPHHTPEQITHIYRLAQEAVGNSIRHGRATAITISIAVQDASAELRIEDNGAGFPANASRPEGIGMHVMQFRAQVLGGSVNFSNRQPAGAVVQLNYPLGRSRLTPAESAIA